MQMEKGIKNRVIGGVRSGVRPIRSRRGGFSLLELMIAMAVIAIALFGILAMVTQTMSMKEIARENELAKEWAQKRIEEVKAQNFTNLPSVSPAGKQRNLPSTSLVTGTLSTGYKAVYTLSNFASPYDDPCPPFQLANATGTVVIDYSNSNIYEIVANITWKSRKGNLSYTIRNLYAHP